jgi:hypothetical protein
MSACAHHPRGDISPIKTPNVFYSIKIISARCDFHRRRSTKIVGLQFGHRQKRYGARAIFIPWLRGGAAAIAPSRSRCLRRADGCKGWRGGPGQTVTDLNVGTRFIEVQTPQVGTGGDLILAYETVVLECWRKESNVSR